MEFLNCCRSRHHVSNCFKGVVGGGRGWCGGQGLGLVWRIGVVVESRGWGGCLDICFSIWLVH